MNKISTYVLGILCLVITDSYSQELFIKEVMFQPWDRTAIIEPCFDNNGDTCALVRIVTDNLIGLEFDNSEQYVKTQTKEAGIYEIYMPYILNKLSYKHKEYLSGQINFADFGYKRLKEGKTYVVKIETPSSKGKVVLKVQPSTAAVIFNGLEVQKEQSGIYEFTVSPGTYQYSVKASDYTPYQGLVQIGKSEVKTIPLSLKPIIHPIYIECNVDDAKVYIDGIDYGEAGEWINIAQGTHEIRISKDKYIDVNETIEIDSTISQFSYSLEKNRNLLEIHAIPITIITNSKKIYKNNRQLKDWGGSGSAVNFMPGKYMISDDWGKHIIIEVIDQPFTVTID